MPIEPERGRKVQQVLLFFVESKSLENPNEYRPLFESYLKEGWTIASLTVTPPNVQTNIHADGKGNLVATVVAVLERVEKKAVPEADGARRRAK